MADGDDEVILVPPEARSSLAAVVLGAKSNTLRVQSIDGDQWLEPTSNELGAIRNYFDSSEDHRFLRVGVGTTIGYDETGIFIQSEHTRRYFGVLRSMASVALKKAAPEAVPKTQFFGKLVHNEHASTEKLFTSMLSYVPSLSDETRAQIMRTTFRSVDKNGNGTLEKDELIALMRKVMPTMSGKQVVSLMDDVDTDKNKRVDYNEFTTWLTKHANPEINAAVSKAFGTHVDCIGACFRVWDLNGDGMISKKELCQVLKRAMPEITEVQIKTIALHLDQDKDGRVSYREFINFMFPQ